MIRQRKFTKRYFLNHNTATQNATLFVAVHEKFFNVTNILKYVS